MPSKRVSVIVPTLNEEAWIERCLAALANQTIPRDKYEVIVSDSCSTDKTVALAEKHADMVSVCKRVGAGYGRNRGIEKANSDNVAFVDADTLVETTFIEGVARALEKNIAATGPSQCLEQDSLLDRLGFRVWGWQTRLTIAVGKAYLPGFNLAVKKKAFHEAGGFEDKGTTCEDFQLCQRLSRMGRIGYEPLMKVKSSARRVREMGWGNYWLTGVKYILFGKTMRWDEHAIAHQRDEQAFHD